MPEPAVSTAVATAAAGLAGASIGALVFSAVGVDPTTIGWALVGGFCGTAYGPKAGPIAAVLNYLAASLLSALGATVLMQWVGNRSDALRYLAAAWLAFSFYPLKDAWAPRVAGVMDRVLDRYLGARHEEKE